MTMGCSIFISCCFLSLVVLASSLVSAKPLSELRIMTAGGGEAADAAALMALKLAITDDPLLSLRNWNYTSNHFCNFTGVKCSSSSREWRVSGIDLYNMSLKGPIPFQIGNLSFLQSLDLSYNGFTGDIPGALGRLRRLRELDLSVNNLTGTIPHQLGNLKNLRSLYSYENAHTGSIPGVLGNCSMLREIDLSENKLTGIIPPEIGRLTRLRFLNLLQNRLSGAIPPSLLNCTELRKLSLTYNGISGPIPSEIGTRLTKLEALLLFGTNLQGRIPASLTNLSRLDRLEIGSRDLGGAIPQELGKLVQLRVLNLAASAFVTGKFSIFEALSNCTKLEKLQLSENRLTGTLPPAIGQLSQTLTLLNVEKNAFNGTIPQAIGNLSALTILYMGRNSLVGTIPYSITNLLDLQALDLNGNKLQGNFPSELQRMNQSLAYLYLFDNRLSGSIPKIIGKLENLRELNLRMNRFHGRIPPEIGQCRYLELLDLSQNKFSGVIPSEVANLRHLQTTFDLSANALTGPVPPEVGGIQMAQLIDLSNNKLSGHVPPQMTQWVGVLYLNLSCNRLTGSIPASIGEKLSLVQVIDLSHNNITGPFPDSISKLGMLWCLNLSYNDLSGSIPCSDAFKKLNNTAFIGNPGLCGKCFGLTDCSLDKPGSTNKKRIILISISCVLCICVVFCIVLVFWIFKQRASKSVSDPTSTPVDLINRLRISREELRRATEDFNPGNLLGVGSYGSVYRATLPGGETVAVKVFAGLDGEDGEKSFDRECRTLGKVRHRNLLKIITACSTEDFKALVLEFMPNGNLDGRLHGAESEKLSLEMRLRILLDVAHGLSYLHHDSCPPIVHCDLKPHNVLLDEDMTAHLADFGLARMFAQSDVASITTSTLKGSIGYTAPEYGVGGEISAKGDVYSYGILTLEVITQKRPTDEMFRGGVTLSNWVSMAGDDIRSELLRGILNANEDTPRVYMVFEALMQLGVWCTAEVPDNRPTMRQVESTLTKLLQTNYDEEEN